MPTSQDPKDLAPRESTRVPLETRVNIEFEKFSGFITEYSANISSGGIFIKTKDPKPVGTILSFEFKLRDNFRLISGLGEVTWARTIDQGALKPAGMGIRFHEIDEQSRELIQTMIDHHLKAGGKPFDLGEPQIPSAPASESTPETLEAKGPAAVEEDFKALFSVADEPTLRMDPPMVGEETHPAQILPDEPSLNILEPKPRSSNPPIDVGHVIEDESFRAPPLIAEEEVKTAVRKSAPASVDFHRTERKSPLKWIVLGVLVLGLGAGGFYFRERIMGLFGTDTEIVAPAKIETPPTAAPSVAAPEATPAAEVAAVATPETVQKAPEPAKPAPAKTAPVQRPPATEVSRIDWNRMANGTEVVLTFDGNLKDSQVTHARVSSGSPREVIQIRGLKKGYRKPSIRVGNRQIKQIRTGFHAKVPENELHVVLDLAGSAVKVANVNTTGNKLSVVVK